MDLFEGNELARLAVTSFEDLGCFSESIQGKDEGLTVAYVPSPSYDIHQLMCYSIPNNEAYLFQLLEGAGVSLIHALTRG